MLAFVAATLGALSVARSMAVEPAGYAPAPASPGAWADDPGGGAPRHGDGHGAALSIERRLALMGTSLELTVDAVSRESALAASEWAVAACERAEARLSTWRDDSELARLNAAPAGTAVALSPALAEELAAARACWRETDGAFDPAIGGLVAAWGLRAGGRVPSTAERLAAVEAGGMDGLALLARRSDGATPAAAVRRRAGLVLEEGGFGKGAGLAAALAALAGAPGVTGATLDLGGQLAFLGDARREVLIADPRRRDRAVLKLAVAGGSVSTSGNGERGTVVAGRRIGHLLDPRSGAPAPDFGSLTVWTADPLRADCLSTGLYVLGPEKALGWAAEHPGVHVLALLVEDGGRLRALASPELRGRLAPLAAGVTIDFWEAGEGVVSTAARR
jgi:thiamine biosynthesis lipoprotein